MTRVAIVVDSPEKAEGLGLWGRRLARALEADLSIFWLIDRPRESRRYTDDPEDADAKDSANNFKGLPEAALALLARLAPGAASDSEPAPEDSAASQLLADPKVDLVWPCGDSPSDAVHEALDQQTVDLLLVMPSENKKPQESIARALFDSVPCRVLLLRPGTMGGRHCQGVVVAASSGSGTREALVLGHKLASAEGIDLDVLHVESAAMESGEAVGEVVIERALRQAKLDRPSAPTSERPRARITKAVVQNDDLTAGIDGFIEQHHDLVLLGASQTGNLRRLLFGTVPERLLTSPRGASVGVVREAWGTGDRFRAQLGRWLDVSIPQLDRQRRVDLYDRLQSGAHTTFDFMLLMTLATAIAGLGLAQNSGAVVIGAMLVAPLMTPILAIGLALLQGNLPLLRSATRSVFAGYTAALIVGMIIGWLAGPAAPTPELLARGGPTLLDMGVAFLSGLAAAYCLGQPGLLAALPGVAIAAALVPPIATTGIALTTHQQALASGSSLLFGTNVVAIVLGAACSFYAVGVRSKRQATNRPRWVGPAFLVLLIILGLLAVPLSRSFKQSRLSTAPPAEVAKAIKARAHAMGLEVSSLRWSRDLPRRLEVTVVHNRALTEAQARRLADSTEELFTSPPTVTVLTELQITLAPPLGE